ncbi:MAG: rRNA maturation RNase YbeY [Synergistaceae bacterium]|nr:rRNA maturation RNase YbeY [Synergistaceae bacterium]
MRSILRIDAQDDGEPPSSQEGRSPAWDILGDAERRALELVLGRELLELCPSLADHEEVRLSVSFLTPDEIRAVSLEHRGQDEATDVLSFPLWEEAGAFVPPPAGGPPLLLGDVLICPEEAARLWPGLSEEEASCLMLAHAFLHLLAWDHDTEERRRAMWDRQDALKAKLLEALDAVEEGPA